MRKLKLNKWFLIILTIFLISCSLEVLLRLTKLVPTRIENESIYPNVLGDYKPSQELLSDYILPHYIKINSLGLRGEEITVDKQKGVYRILMLGDSYTHGARVSNNQTFPCQLETLLNKSKPGRVKIEVINAGHSAYSTREEYEYLLERGVCLNPDMVILVWFPNDLTELSREYSWRDLLKEHYKFEPFKSYIRSLAIFNVLRVHISYAFVKLRFGPYVPKEVINIFDSEDTEIEKKLWNKCFDYILKIKGICNNRIKFLLVTLPDPKQFSISDGFSSQRKLTGFAVANHIDFLDLAEKFGLFALEDDINKLYLLPKDCHFSQLGNKLVAEEISNVVARHILKKK